MNLDKMLKHYQDYNKKSAKEIHNEIKPILDKCYFDTNYMDKLANELGCSYHSVKQWRKSANPYKPSYEKYLKLLIMIQNTI